MNNVLGAKNLLPNNATSQTINGITFTVNADGSVTVNGTATANAELAIATNIPLNGDFILSDAIAGESGHYWAFANVDSGARQYILTNAEMPITVATKLDYFRIKVFSGETVSNVTFKPMLRLASDPDDTYVPYAMTNRVVTSALNHKAPLITTGFDTNYFDELCLWYSEQGATVTVTGMVHATTAFDSWNGAEIVPQNTLPMTAGGIGNISGIALNTTNGGVAYVGTNTGTDLQLVKFDGVGWYRFCLSYVKESL